MGCSCRISPLRIFVQGLAQVHHVDSSFLRLRSSPVSSSLLRTRFAVSRQTRSLHNTIALRSENAAAVKPPSPEVAEGASSTSSDPLPAERDNSQKPEAGNGWKTRKDTSPRERNEKSPKQKKFRSSSERYPSDNKFNNRDFKKQREFGNKPFTKSFSKPSTPYYKPYFKPSLSSETDAPNPEIPHWKKQKEALKEKFPEGWQPRKRLSPDALSGIRALNAQFPDVYTTEALAKKFEVSPENIRRILRSKWTPSVDEEQNRQERWFRRGKTVWESQAALGKKPPRKWRDEGVKRDPSYHSWRQEATRRNQAFENEERGMHRSAWKGRNQGGSS